MFSQEFINTVKKKGVLKLAEKFTTMKQVSPKIWNGPCPNPEHDDRNTPSFTVMLNDDGYESWACFGCHSGPKGADNFGSDNIAFIQWLYYHKKHELLPFVDALKAVAEFYEIPIEQDKNQEFYDKNMRAHTFFRDNIKVNRAAREYLYSRGLDDTDIEKWQIGFINNRISFPIIDVLNRVLGFSCRTIIDAKPKYINSKNSPIFIKGGTFFGLNHFNKNSRYALITEGQFDVILAHKYGIDFAIATLCCKLSDKHVEKLRQSGKIPILCYDGDAAGKEGIEKGLRKLSDAGIKGAKLLLLPCGKDLADISLELKEKLPAYIKEHTVSYSNYLLSNIADKIDSAINNELQKAMPSIRRAIVSIPDQEEKDVAKSYIRSRLHLWVN